MWLLKNADIMKGKSTMKVKTQKKRLDKKYSAIGKPKFQNKIKIHFGVNRKRIELKIRQVKCLVI